MFREVQEVQCGTGRDLAGSHIRKTSCHLVMISQLVVSVCARSFISTR